MKKSAFIYGVIMFITSFSCERYDNSEIFFIIKNGPAFTFSDIELYDSSTCILYFKTEHEEFSSILKDTFAFLEKGQIIFQGRFVPSYSSSIPAGPFIMSPSIFGNYALKISESIPVYPDLRNCPKIISILEERNLMHSGLSGVIDTIEIDGFSLTYKFTITNHDVSDLLILDINKTGPFLFQYFTNGLFIRDLDNNVVFSSVMSPQTPDPWNSWKIEWLSQIKSGESIQFTIMDILTSNLSPDEYIASFEFPGLSYQVSKEQLNQNNNRIWLGDIQLTKRITIK